MSDEYTRKLVEVLVSRGHAPDLQLAKQLLEAGVVVLNGHVVKNAEYRVGVGWEYQLRVGMVVDVSRY